jgi:hypothetical protein
MKHFILILPLLFIFGCKTTKDMKLPDKKATELVDDEVQRLDDVIADIDQNTRDIETEGKILDKTADKIKDSDIKSAVKMSSQSIQKANSEIKRSNTKIKEVVKPGLIKAKKEAIKTEKKLEEAEENKALRAWLNRIIIFCLFGLGISIGISIKFPAMGKFSEVSAYSFGGILIGCSCYQWLMNNPWVSGAVTIIFIAGGIIWGIIKHQKEIKEALDLVKDDDKDKLNHCKKYL